MAKSKQSPAINITTYGYDHARVACSRCSDGEAVVKCGLALAPTGTTGFDPVCDACAEHSRRGITAVRDLFLQAFTDGDEAAFAMDVLEGWLWRIVSEMQREETEVHHRINNVLPTLERISESMADQDMAAELKGVADTLHDCLEHYSEPRADAVMEYGTRDLTDDEEQAVDHLQDRARWEDEAAQRSAAREDQWDRKERENGL